MFANITGFHLLIVLGVVVLLFGAAKLPLLAKNLGQSAKILKSEIGSMHEEPTAAPVAVPEGLSRSNATAAEVPPSERR